jgi:CO/xanthine dehydrogenase FAD-binding subunit
MGLPAFEYLHPDSLDQALRFLHGFGGAASAIAGGTDLIVQLRSGKRKIEALVDIGRLKVCRGIRLDSHGLRMGALETHASLATSRVVSDLAPALAAACRSVGAPPVRNRGTLGGNLATASPAADTAPPLLVLDARAHLVSLEGARDVPLSEFFAGPGQTCLRRGELIESISFDVPAFRSASVFVKLGKRNALAVAVASAAVYLALQEGTRQVLDARIALGSVAPTPIRAREAEQILQGREISRERIREAARCAAGAARPISDARASADYRRALSAILVERAVTDALHRATRQEENL